MGFYWESLLEEEQESNEDFQCLIENNEKNQEKKLEIIDIIIDSLPDKIKQFDWIETLILKNNNLTDLLNLPPNLKTLEVYNNSISELDGDLLPVSVEKLVFKNNDTVLVFNLKEGIKHLNLGKNDIHEIDKIPTTVTNLFLLNNNSLNKIPNCKNNKFEKVDISETNIKDMSNFPDDVESLAACLCTLGDITYLPNKLKKFVAFRSEVSSIKCQLSLELVELDLYENMLSEMQNLPETIKIVDLASNNLKTVPYFPTTIKTIDFKDNDMLPVDQLKKIKKENPSINITFTNKSESESKNIFDISNNHTTNAPQNRQLNFMRQFERANEANYLIGDELNENNPHFIQFTKRYTL
jgi:hypothetical protein